MEIGRDGKLSKWQECFGEGQEKKKKKWNIKDKEEEQCQEGWSLKLLHDGRSPMWAWSFLQVFFHTVLITSCFLFQTATGVLIQLRHKRTDAGRRAEAWDDMKTGPLWTWGSGCACGVPLCRSQPLDTRTTHGSELSQTRFLNCY